VCAIFLFFISRITIVAFEFWILVDLGSIISVQTFLMSEDLSDKDLVDLVVSLADVSCGNDIFATKSVGVVDCKLSTSLIIRFLDASE